MRNIALKLMYNGTAYHGWQMQRTEASVQETLQRGLSMVCGERVRLTGVGRTDAGVHAERYVANFRTSSRIPIDRLPFAVNTHTPEDIVVREALEVADDFNAIGSCLKKEYTYRIYNSRIKNPFYVNRAYFYPKKLDEAVMDAAARAFEGTHDFRAVRSVGTETKTTVRTVHYCRVSRSGDLLEVCADGFLYNMVRAITGTVLYAAEGKLTAEDIPKILDSGDRTLAGPTVPPGGLYMTHLWYDDGADKFECSCRDTFQVAVPVAVGDVARIVLADDRPDGTVARHLPDVVAGRDGSLVEPADAACPGPSRGLALYQPVVVAGDDLGVGALTRDAARIPLGAHLARIVA